MKPIETERLILRKFNTDDFQAVHSYSSSVENTLYMLFGPNDEAATRSFIDMAIAHTSKSPITYYTYAVTLAETGELIGGCDLHVSGNEAEIGWLLHRDHWKKGYGTELGFALIKFGFDELKLHRIVANCDAENTGSSRLMTRIGMRKEGLFYDARTPNKLTDRPYSDQLSYAILRDEWEIQKDVFRLTNLPCEFDGFIQVPELKDGDLYLVCEKKEEGNTEKKWVPGYKFAICSGGEKIGHCDLRIGYTEGLYYGGNIGYGIDEPHRGKGYAARACRLLIPVARAHKMVLLLITNDIKNDASKRVCDKLGAKHVRTARLPEWTDLYQGGQRFSNVFEWDIV